MLFDKKARTGEGRRRIPQYTRLYAASVLLGNWVPVLRSQSPCKHTSSSFLSPRRRAMTALRPVAWEAWVAVWLRLHPREDHRGVPREERQRSFPKRAAFALVTAAENLPGRDLGAQPCELCGQWTHSWCEACSLRPVQRRLYPVRCRSPYLSTMPASWAVVGSGPRC